MKIRRKELKKERISIVKLYSWLNMLKREITDFRNLKCKKSWRGSKRRDSLRKKKSKRD